MQKHIKVLLYGNAQECRATAEIFRALDALFQHSYEFFCVDDQEAAEKELVDWEPSLLVVLADGAEGMECVYRSRERRPCIPVFWFSDDPGFGIQSYRMDCAYFSTKPVTQGKIELAIRRCDRMCIQYSTAD